MKKKWLTYLVAVCVVVFLGGCGGGGNGNSPESLPVTVDNNPVQLSPPDLYGALLPNVVALLQPGVIYTGEERLHFELLAAPDQMEVDPRSGLVIWTPTNADAGSVFNVHLQVTDGIATNSVAFAVRVAMPTAIETIAEDLPEGRTRVTVTEADVQLQGLQVILPPDYVDASGATLSTGLPAVSLVDPADVPVGGAFLLDTIIQLTEFFYIDPVVSDAEYIEIVFPGLLLPGGRNAEELVLYVFDEPLGRDPAEPNWLPVTHALNVDPDGQVSILIAATGSLSFIGIPADEAPSQPSEPATEIVYSLAVPFQGMSEVKITCEGAAEQLCVAELPQQEFETGTCGVPGLSDCEAKFTIKGFSDHNWWGPEDFSVHYVAGWAVDALLKFEVLGLAYDDWSSAWYGREKPNIEVNIEQLKCSRRGEMRLIEKYRVIHLNSYKSCPSHSVSTQEMAGTLAHEYFHHAQYKTGNLLGLLTVPSKYARKWLIEGSAVWFEDEVFDQYNSHSAEVGSDILTVGLNVRHQDSPLDFSGYHRWAFFKLLQRSRSVKISGETVFDRYGCDFEAKNDSGRTFLAELVNNHSNWCTSPDGGTFFLCTGGAVLKNVVEDPVFQCAFDTDFGEGRIFGNALESYSYATQIEKNIELLDHNELFVQWSDPIAVQVGLPSSPLQSKLLPPLSSNVFRIEDGEEKGFARTLVINSGASEVLVSRRSSKGHWLDSFVIGSGTSEEFLGVESLDGMFVTFVNDDPDQDKKIEYALRREEWNMLAAFVRDSDGQEYWLEGKRSPRADGTSWFEFYGPDGIFCSGEFDASGGGVLTCNNGWSFLISIPQAVYEKGSGSHHTHSDDGFFVSIGWGGHANRDTLLERVVFVSQVDGAWDIFSVVLDGSDLVNLTETTANDRLPAVSPSLTKIAFVSDRDGQNDIYVMNIDGSDVKRLTNHHLDDAFPVWSPDGNKIAFISQRGSGGRTYDIYVMDSDGGNVVRLTDSPKHDTQPHWSPDGEYIVFVSEREGASDIFLMKADGSDQTNLTKTLATDTIPFFSPDGLQIAFVSDRDGDFDLWIMDVNGQNLVKLTSDGTDGVGWYSWSPDGSLIAFDSMASGVYNIYVVDPVTGIIRQVTDSTASDRFASWTWFGSKIAYLSDEDGTYMISVVDPDGQGVVRLFEGVVGEVFLPAASPVYDEGGGCFIATAAYGSYLEPRVGKLRDFRDDYLLATSLGKVFVSHYYMWSPPIADVIRQHESLRVITRAILTPIVFGVQYPMQSSLILFVVGFVLVKRSRRESSRRGKRVD